MCRLFENVSVPTTHTVHISMSGSSTAANTSYVAEVTVDGEALPSELHLGPAASDGGGLVVLGELVSDVIRPNHWPIRTCAPPPPPGCPWRVSPSFPSRAFTFIHIPHQYVRNPTFDFVQPLPANFSFRSRTTRRPADLFSTGCQRPGTPHHRRDTRLRLRLLMAMTPHWTASCPCVPSFSPFGLLPNLSGMPPSTPPSPPSSRSSAPRTSLSAMHQSPIRLPVPLPFPVFFGGGGWGLPVLHGGRSIMADEVC